MILLVISLAILLTYIVSVVVAKGIPASVSATYYSIKHPVLFSIIVVASALILLPTALEHSREGTEFMLFLSVIGMVMTGIAPHFKGKDKTMHETGAAMLLGCSQSWVTYNATPLMWLWLIFAVYMICATIKNYKGDTVKALLSAKSMFWAEITTIATVYGGLVMRILKLI